MFDTSEPHRLLPPDGGQARLGPPLAHAGDPMELESGEQFARLMAMLGAVEVTVSDTAMQLVDAAASAMPCADGVALALINEDGSVDLVANQDDARRAAELERTLGEGPSIDAVELGHPVDCEDVCSDGRWPRLAAGLDAPVTRSILSVPLVSPPRVLGALTVYAHAPAAFDDRTRRLAVRMAGAAARTLHNAPVLDRSRPVAPRLHVVEVDRAIEVLMTENGVSAEEALGVLQLLGRTEQEDVSAVARSIVAARTGSGEHDQMGAGS